jgi:signal recognition particle subunit SRP72
MADAVAALNSLLRRATVDDPGEALKIANAAIKAGKGSPDLETAQHTKVVALLKLDRFDDALRALADAGSALESRCATEKAYALYKTGKLDEAAALCAGSSSRGARHVAAQAAYRAERFADAADLYAGLEDDEDGGARVGEDADTRINVLATRAQLEWSGQGGARIPADERQPARQDMEAFETAYNAACGCLGRGEYERALVLLKRARDLAEASEAMSLEEKKAEVLPIMVQQAYAFERLGKRKEAGGLHVFSDLTE